MSERNYLFIAAMVGLLLIGVSDPLLGQSGIVREAQEKLSEKGFDPGPVDGLMGPQTRQAIRIFQRSNDLQESGRLDEPTQKALGLEIDSVRVPAGTRIQVRLNERLYSGDAKAGDRFSMTVDQAVAVGNAVVIPAGAQISGRVAEAESAQRPQKGGRLVLEADGVRLQSHNEPLAGTVTAEGEELEGEGSLREDLARIGIGAGAGGVLGGIIGGKRGALIGILVGGGGTFMGTKGEQVELPRETRLVVETTQEASLPRLQ
ncbi:MAG TPA: peptidoglycan-binding domain-containing protein [Acidobacteriota bacterium]|nr:peptidoglycan-binding domain-containing protein [Acidobacteriota bacterium]